MAERLLPVMRIGYARVSTKEQNLDLQLLALKADGCRRVYQERISGRAKHRPVLAEALAVLKPGDTLVIWHLDRLGRTTRELINLYYDFKDQGIEIASLTQRIDTECPEGEHAFIVSCADAQLESAKISRRTKAGLAAARQRGAILGRPRALHGARLRRAKKLFKIKHSVPEVAVALSISRTTAWRSLCREGMP